MRADQPARRWFLAAGEQGVEVRPAMPQAEDADPITPGLDQERVLEGRSQTASHEYAVGLFQRLDAVGRDVAGDERDDLCHGS